MVDGEGGRSARVGAAVERVVIGRGPTPVKILFRLWLQKFVPGVVPQPLARVEARDSTTKHEHKPNQQKITTQIKQPETKCKGRG